jgi:CRP-like cAMP-binding protein
MPGVADIAIVSLLAFIATGSYLIGLGYGLYLPMSKRLLSTLLAFASGALICALAVKLGMGNATELHERSYSLAGAWALIGGGFAVGAVFYYITTRLLEAEGAAIRYPTRFREYARRHKRENAEETIALLAKSNLLCHLPPEEIERILPIVRRRALNPGRILFRTGDRGDALYIVAKGKVEVVEEASGGEFALATLGPGQTFGEMALLSGGPRSATVRAIEPTEVMEIARRDFRTLVTRDKVIAETLQRMSYDRAIANLASGGANPETWTKIATASVEPLSQSEADELLVQAAHGAGLAIVFGSFLDTIPGCLVIGAQYTGLDNPLPLTLILAFFLSGIPEAAASGAMLKKAGFTAGKIFLLWSSVIVAGVLAGIAGNVLLAGAESATAAVAQALAGGAILALVAHTLIPEAIEQGGSLIVLPTVAGFVIALYLAMVELLH